MTRDPETRFTQTNNVQVTSFTLAVNRRFAKQGEQQADFINCVAWNKTAEFVSKYFRKGQQVAIVGRIQTRTYTDNNNQTRYITEVIAEEVYFADSNKSASNQTTDQTDNNEDEFMTSGDDLPF